MTPSTRHVVIAMFLDKAETKEKVSEKAFLFHMFDILIYTWALDVEPQMPIYLKAEGW